MLYNGFSRRDALSALAALAATPLLARKSFAAGVIKIGAVQSMTGPFAQNGIATMAGARLYMQQNGDNVAGQKIELIIKDDASAPDASKRLAQELIVNDGIALLLGGITPSALSMAPLATAAKVPMIVLVSASSITVEKSPYIVRTSFTVGQASTVIADWAAKNGARKIVTLVNDWAPGAEAEATFKMVANKGGAAVIEAIRAPLQTLDFAPFLQRASDAAPDTLFAFVPNHQASTLMKQFVERGLDKSGIRFVATGDLAPDDDLANMPDAMLGLVTAHHYCANHPSALNKDYVAGFQRANGRLPSFHSVAGYDAMHLMYETLRATSGDTSADSLIGAMKGKSWESPRGPISIDSETRDIVQNEYLRRVERVDGKLANVEFATVEAVKDPLHGVK